MGKWKNCLQRQLARVTDSGETKVKSGRIDSCQRSRPMGPSQETTLAVVTSHKPPFTSAISNGFYQPDTVRPPPSSLMNSFRGTFSPAFPCDVPRPQYFFQLLILLNMFSPTPTALTPVTAQGHCTWFANLYPCFCYVNPYKPPHLL